jgi:hypothetical protein
MEAQGENYRHAQPFYQMYMGEEQDKTLAEIMEEENNYE